MAIRNIMNTFVLAAAALASAPGCDAELTGEDHGLEDNEAQALVFRSDDCNPLLVNCHYRNDFYMGLDEYAIENLPLVAGSDSNATITKIITHTCTDSGGGELVGKFRALLPSLTVDAFGNFGPLLVEDVTAPGNFCHTQGGQFKNSKWFVTANAKNAAGQLDTVFAKLKIAKIFETAGESTLYYWQTDLEYLYDDTTLGWEYTCDEDPDPLLDFHSTVYPNLRISETNGEFGSDADTFYLGCTSGLVAKSGYTWGYYSEPPSVHQVITYAGMARYCGPTGASHTQTGKAIRVWNKTGSGPDLTPIDLENDPDWAPEAAWDSSMSAMCIGKTRMENLQPAETDPGFDCGGGTIIPHCTPEILNDPDVVLITFAEK